MKLKYRKIRSTVTVISFLILVICVYILNCFDYKNRIDIEMLVDSDKIRP